MNDPVKAIGLVQTANGWVVTLTDVAPLNFVGLMQGIETNIIKGEGAQVLTQVFNKDNKSELIEFLTKSL